MKQKAQYESEIAKLQTAKDEAEARVSDEEKGEIEAKQKLLQGKAEEIVGIQKRKAEAQTEYFALRNEFDSQSATKTELWKKIGAAQGKVSAAALQEEITALEYENGMLTNLGRSCGKPGRRRRCTTSPSTSSRSRRYPFPAHDRRNSRSPTPSTKR